MWQLVAAEGWTWEKWQASVYCQNLWFTGRFTFDFWSMNLFSLFFSSFSLDYFRSLSGEQPHSKRTDITYWTGKRKTITVNCRYKFGEWSYQKLYEMTTFLHRYVTLLSRLYWCTNLILLPLCNTWKSGLNILLRAEKNLDLPTSD